MTVFRKPYISPRLHCLFPNQWSEMSTWIWRLPLDVNVILNLSYFVIFTRQLHLFLSKNNCEDWQQMNSISSTFQWTINTPLIEHCLMSDKSRILNALVILKFSPLFTVLIFLALSLLIIIIKMFKFLLTFRPIQF